ncbi:MAG: TetR/AcrR family transcriptional regulator [Desulfomonilia bacterium]
MKHSTLGLRKNLKELKRREAIISSAIQVFSAKGYERATMDDIAADIGLSKALIYWYWENKAALFSELVDQCMMPYCHLLQKTIDSPDPFGEKLTLFLTDFTRLFKNNEALNKLVHFGSLHSHSINEKENFSEKVNAYYQRVQDLLHELLSQGVKQGYFKADLDKKALSFFLLLAVEGYIYMSMLEERMPVERALVDFARNIIFPAVIRKG